MKRWRMPLISHARSTVPGLYLRMKGRIFFSERNAPFLNENIMYPLLQAPSGNIIRGGNSSFSAISVYLSLMISKIYSLSSFVPPLGMNKVPLAFAIVPNKGTFERNLAPHILGDSCLANINGSNQLT